MYTETGKLQPDFNPWAQKHQHIVALTSHRKHLFQILMFLNWFINIDNYWRFHLLRQTERG